MMLKWPSRYDILVFVWPVTEPSDPAEAAAYAKRMNEEQKAALSHINNLTNTDDVDFAITALEFLLSDERERRQSIQTRLAGLLGFATVAATIGLAVASAIVDVRANFPLPVRIILGVLAFYAVIQLVLVGYHSIEGLRHVPYLGITLDDVLSEQIKTSVAQKWHYLRALVQVFHDDRELNNHKLDAMTLAHASARNYIVGIAVFILVTLGIRVLAVPQPSVEQVVRELRSNPRLLELLRGPRGDAGPMGPAGPPGVAGPMGPAGGVCQCEPQRPNTDNLPSTP
jgi:hypothetical protein